MGPGEDEDVNISAAAHTICAATFRMLAHPGLHHVLLPLVEELVPLVAHLPGESGVQAVSVGGVLVLR